MCLEKLEPPEASEFSFSVNSHQTHLKSSCARVNVLHNNSLTPLFLFFFFFFTNSSISYLLHIVTEKGKTTWGRGCSPHLRIASGSGEKCSRRLAVAIKSSRECACQVLGGSKEARVAAQNEQDGCPGCRWGQLP